MIKRRVFSRTMGPGMTFFFAQGLCGRAVGSRPDPGRVVCDALHKQILPKQVRRFRWRKPAASHGLQGPLLLARPKVGRQDDGIPAIS